MKVFKKKSNLQSLKEARENFILNLVSRDNPGHNICHKVNKSSKFEQGQKI